MKGDLLIAMAMVSLADKLGKMADQYFEDGDMDKYLELRKRSIKAAEIAHKLGEE